MGEFWTRAISLVAVIVCLTGYNTVLDKREQAEEKLKSSRQRLEQEQSGNAAEEATEVAYKDGTYYRRSHRDLADRWMWKLSLKRKNF